MKRALALTALLAALPRPAHADKREASIHLHAVLGAALLDDDRAPTAATVPLGGLAGRATYATSHLFAYELSAALLATSAARYDDVTIETPGGPLTGDLERTTRIGRLLAGATVRLGVQYIPTLHLAFGAQTRWRSPARLLGPALSADVTDSDLALDLVAAAGLGFDYRLNRHIIIGISADLIHALPLDGPAFESAETFLHASYYWYPRW